MITIRPLTHQEIPRLAEIRPEFIAHTVIEVERIGNPPFAGWRLYEKNLEKPFDKGEAYDFDSTERENVAARLSQANSLVEIVEDRASGRFVGILEVEEHSWHNTAWIWNLMLDKDFRGRGLGRTLLDRAIKWSRSRGLRAVMLETQSNNTLACHFYARMGFELVGINDHFYTNEDVSRREVALFWALKL